ncbi:MFS general substrate transporter [Meira miltonrushii]|uniref:MFS general substrate transporter n=1 Tax=Meira miltonrushii TaxID=1280837 RepID=A0A316VIV2_9BASI|nr:MFS general substrate transporter [Meira miltonrushii]PWN35951.1 MFS general substrate transporter [Meira miltonrushii]
MKDLTNGLFKLPSKEERRIARAGAPINPIKLIAMLTPMQGLMFFSGWLAWVMDAWDFFSVSLSVTSLVKQFDKPDPTSVTTAITLTLLFRPLGAIIFGLASDRYGRKWPLVINLIIIAVLSLGTGFVQTFAQFLAVRSLFGIGMGGIWGMAASTALESMPAAPRGLFSGVLQQGYPVGYLFAASANLKWVAPANNWRYLFYLGAGLSLFAALVRVSLPESEVFRKVQEERKASGTQSNKGKEFMRQTWEMLKHNWPRVIYGILLMTGFNFFSHSSQDLYPTMIEKDSLAYLPDPEAKLLASKATIIGNCGAIAGGFVAGYLSQYFGRRLTIIAFTLLAAAMIPAWILPKSFSGLAAGAFFLQFGVQGAWGVIPIYLNEISPPAFRATFPGVAYQVGNMVSAASAQIESTGGVHNQKPNPRYTPGSTTQKPTINNYALVSAILLGVVCAYIIIVVLFGEEYRGAHFENAPVATEAHAGEIDPEELVQHSRRGSHAGGEDSIEHVGDMARTDEKSDDASNEEKR